MTPPSVTFVVVAFGHARQLPATLRSIAAQDYPAPHLDVIVVENGDGDSAAATRATLPAACVLEPGRNLGFAGGCNLAVATTRADVIILTNPDVELAPDFAAAVARALEDQEAGIVGARLLFPDRRTIQHAGGQIELPLALTGHRGYGEPDGPAFAAPADVPYVTGAALGIRREVWERLGGLDESFAPAYYEEVDLCLRAAEAGLRVRYLPEASGIHQESSALGRTSVSYFRLYHANRLRLLFKHYADSWLVCEWLPAELRHLRTTADDNEIDGLAWAYRVWQAHFLAGNRAPDLRLEGWQAEAAEQGPPAGSELAWTLEQARLKRTLTPEPFRSRIPAVARVRQWWNRVATEEYLRPIIQQQNDLNATMVELAHTLERQRRTTDAAILCQGMLLAKVMGGRWLSTD